eukprot:835500-Alexandrium_andersonii.AAC.1
MGHQGVAHARAQGAGMVRYGIHQETNSRAVAVTSETKRQSVERARARGAERVYYGAATD